MDKHEEQAIQNVR